MADALIASIRSNLRSVSTNETRHTLQLEAEQLRDYGHEAGLSTIQLNAVVRLALIAASADKVVSRANKVALRLMGACTPKKGARLKHSAVLRIMGCLGNSPPLAEGIAEKDERKHKVDVKVQECALKLLVCFLEPPSSLPTPADLPTSFLTPKARHTLAQSYAVLFHFLDYQTLRPHLCALLCALTRRAHVKPYRIARLLSLRAQQPLDTSLSLLFSTYATFVPSLLFTANLASGASKSAAAVLLGATAASALKPPDSKWLANVCSLHSVASAAQQEQEQEESADLPSAPKKARLARNLTTSRKSTITSLLPSPTCHARGLAPLITEPRTPTALGGVLHRLVMPAQLGAALGHAQSRLALIAASSPTSTAARSAADGARVAGWVCARLEDELALTSNKEGARKRVEAIVSAAQRTWSIVGLPIAATAWLSVNARAGIEALLPLVALLPPKTWEAFKVDVLSPMADAARKGKGGMKAEGALCTMAAMLERWARKDWADVKGARGRIAYYDATPLDAEVDYAETVRQTAAFAADLAEELLSTMQPSVSTQHAYLRLYETLAHPRLVGQHTILLPLPTSLFQLLLSRPSGIASLSRLAALVQRVRATFNAHESDADGAKERGAEYFTDVNRVRLNESVVVLADATWRFGKGLGSVEDGAFRVGFPPSNIKHLKARCEERGSDLASVASIMQGTPFLTIAEAYANELASAQGYTELIRGPITAGALRDARKHGLPSLNDFRVGLLGYMEQRGIVGLVRLLRATMSSLNSAASASAAAASSQA